MSLPTLPNTTARNIFLTRHGLAGTPTGQGKGADLQGVVDSLGFVQLDSINTVARAHHMTLHARRTQYRDRNLHALYDNDRGMFEHWTHDASMISMAFFPHWKLKFRRYEDGLAEQWRKWRREGFEEKLDGVLQHISDHGCCGTSDVGKDEQRSSGGWWEWNPSKTALEYLWRTGKISVSRRDGFRKIYDLTERVIPETYLTQSFELSETIDWACRSALDRLGFGTSGEIAAFWDLISAMEAREWCEKAKNTGEIVEVGVQGADGSVRRCFVWAHELDDQGMTATSAVRILSPFDPALRDRKRAERLFGFSYRIEIFVPEAKRKYGYYVFPILEDNRIIGRVDMKALRDKDCLHVRALWPEQKVNFSGRRLAKFELALERTARLARVSSVTFEDNWLRSGD